MTTGLLAECDHGKDPAYCTTCVQEAQDLSAPGMRLFGNYCGLSAVVSAELDAGEVVFTTPTEVLVDPWFGTRFLLASTQDREPFLQDLRRVKLWLRARVDHRGKLVKPSKSVTPPTLQTLTYRGEDEDYMAKYTVGASNKPVRDDSRAAKERRARLGIDTVPDRIKDLAASARQLLSMAVSGDALTEGRYVEVQTRRMELQQQYKILREEIERIGSDLELVDFACEEADPK